MEKVPLSDHESAEAVEGIHLTQLAVGERGSIQHFHIEPGAVVPEHSHHHEQLGYIFDGVLTFVVDGEEVEIGPDDSYRLASEEPHAAENKGDVPVMGIDIFCPPRTNPDWME
jgi:quercetin dioxygenase-like cupin family protein